MTMGFRVDEESELDGIDSAEHAETGYDLVGTATSGMHLAGALNASTKSSNREGVEA